MKMHPLVYIVFYATIVQMKHRYVAVKTYLVETFDYSQY